MASSLTSKPFKALTFLIAELWSYSLINYVRVIIMHMPVVNVLEPFVIPVFIITPLIICLPEFRKHIKGWDLVFYATLVIVYGADFIFRYKNYDQLISYLPLFFIGAIPYYYIGLSIDLKKTGHLLYQLSLICIIVSAFYYLLYFQQADNGAREIASGGDMAASYGLMPHLLLVLFHAMKTPKILNIAVSSVGIFLIMSFGSRGPLVCTLLFIAIYLLFIKKYKYPSLSKTIIVIVLIISSVYLNQFVEFMQIFTQQIGMSSRVFDKAEQGAFLNYQDSSGRDEISEKLLAALFNNNGFGFGIGGDRVICGSYAHNLAVELWVSYGIYIGSVLLIVMIIIFGRGLILAPTEDERIFLWILLFCGFFKLFLSGTYLDEPYLFLALGYAINLKRNNEDSSFSITSN